MLLMVKKIYRINQRRESLNWKLRKRNKTAKNSLLIIFEKSKNSLCGQNCGQRHFGAFFEKMKKPLKPFCFNGSRGRSEVIRKALPCVRFANNRLCSASPSGVRITTKT